MKTRDLEGQVALVTGSTRGIGQAVAVLLAQRGANVIINSRTESEKVYNELETIFKNYKWDYIQADVTNEEQIAECVQRIKGNYEHLDILVNNVGKSEISSTLSVSGSKMDELYYVNLKSTFLMTKHVLKMMLRQRYGRIINISSMAGVTGMAAQSYYAAYKAAIIGYTKSVAREFATKNITCNVIAPGALSNNPLYSKEMQLEAIRTIPLGRLGGVEDIAPAVAFLASREAGYITGQLLQINGGMGM